MIYNNPSGLNLFETKWQRNNLVSTDYNESKFISNNGHSFVGRVVPEKYTYYYHTLEIVEIIRDWTNKFDFIKHQSYQIGNDKDIPDLVRLVPIDLGNKINKIHRLTIVKNNNCSKKALLVAGTHAREVASVTSLIAYIDHILNNNPDNILEQWKLDVILLLNPLGYFIDNNRTYQTVNGDIHNKEGIYHRKNDRNLRNFNLSRTIEPVELNQPRMLNNNSGDCGAEIPSQIEQIHDQPRGNLFTDIGVDLNRNSGMDFILNGLKYNGWVGGGTGEINPGTKANSEREIQIFQKIFQDVNPDLFITIHGYGNLIVTSDVYDDSKTMDINLKRMQHVYGLKMNQRNNVPSCYHLSQLIKDTPFYQKIIKSVNYNDNKPRVAGDKINFPLEVSPLGTATGDMTYWSYCYYYNQKRTRPYCGFTLELGCNNEDRFYPNKYQMIDIVYNAFTVIQNALLSFKC